MKSGYASLARPNSWRLKKTLARTTDFRPIEAEDMRAVFAAYRVGAIHLAPGLDKDQFKDAFAQYVVGSYDACWTLFAETKKLGFIPIGLFLGFWPHHEINHVMVGNDFIWFPWSSKRNRLEAAIGFLNGIRDQIPMIFFARPGEKKFFEVAAKHGILRRIGTSENAFQDVQASVWETRTE